jgi:cyclopropane-fatty-acyl-phospholipid synthase
MSDASPLPTAARPRRGPGPFGWLVARKLAGIVAGRIVVQMPNGARHVARGAAPGPEAVLVLHRWRALWRLLIEGDLGFAEAYMDADWSTPDLPALLAFGAVNQDAIGVEAGRPLRLLRRVRHRCRANTRAGSRRNIEAHYDIGNEFYAAWLDAGMNYSAALFEHGETTLEAAQAAKLDRVVAALEIAGTEHVLEIGCGWGALAQALAARGCRVTGLTLSPAQRNYAGARLADAGLAPRAELRLQDYRDVSGRFDRIVSVEMLEAVGEEFWPDYFRTLARCLAPHGTAVLQFISIAEQRFAAYRAGVDFIQRHIFPGGLLPTIGAVRAEAARAGLAVETVAQFAAGYAATLAEWRRRFQAAWPALRTQGFDERFGRKWDYYLAYCEAGFRSGALDVGIYRLRHAGG